MLWVIHCLSDASGHLNWNYFDDAQKSGSYMSHFLIFIFYLIHT